MKAILVVIVMETEHFGFYTASMLPKGVDHQMEWQTVVHPDKTAPKEQSDLGLHYLSQYLGRIAQLVGHLTHKPEVLRSIHGLATYFHFSFR